MDWQPIETAPKDGTEVLLYCAGGICIGPVPFGVIDIDVEIGGRKFDPQFMISHWMPLPEPPK